MRPFNYMRASSLTEAVDAYVPGAKYIAGGTTLYDLMKLRVEEPVHLIDVTGISELNTIETTGDVLRFGALALMSDVAYTPMIRDEYPVLSESLLKAASQQLRNMATVGGNVLQRTRCPYFRNGAGSISTVGTYPCNKRAPGSGCAAIGGLDRSHAVLGGSDACIAVSPGDWPVALMAMGASIEIHGQAGKRTLPIAEFYRLPGQTPDLEFNINPGEVITAITVPKVPSRSSTYHKIRDRESFAFALASAAVMVEMEETIVKKARIALGGVATIPWRAHGAEDLLQGKRLTPELALEAGRAAFRGSRAGQHNAFKSHVGARVVADALIIASKRSA